LRPGDGEHWKDADSRIRTALGLNMCDLLQEPSLSKRSKRGYGEKKVGGASLSPTVLREGEFRFFFFSREESRRHIHVSHPDGEAKFWLEPTIELARNIGLSSAKLKEAERLIKSRQNEITDAWINHFGG
jgi:hypothetical protein